MNEYRSLNPCCMLSPVPAVLVSCRAAPDARPNALTIAWAGTVCSHPPMVSVSIRPERYSYDLIAQSGEFVINMADAAHAKALDYCGIRSGRDEDKLAACGLTARPMPGMRTAPAIADMPASLGCRVTEVKPLGSHTLFLAEVVSVQVREDLFDADGSMHLERAGLICYSHGVYQRAEGVEGFFGWSVARPEVYRRRMASYSSDRSDHS